MADVKISQLPAATTPVDGTEVLPIVQSATTKQVSIANLTAGRAMAASSLTLTTPLAVTSGGTGLAAGTSGGIPYYSSTTAITSSAALAANALVIGGGAGVAPSTTTTASGILTFLGTPSSANLAAAVTDETGTGALVFGTSPTFTTSLTSPLVIGGTTASSSLTLQSTSGVGTSDSILFKVGNNGATTAATIDSAGNLGVGSTTPAGAKLFINGGSLFTGSPGSYGVGISGSLTSGRIGTYGTNTASAINTYFDDSTIELSAGVTSGYVTGISITGRSGSAYGDTIRFVTRGTGTNEAARIDSSGNVGIGTTAPNYKLDVAGLINTTDQFRSSGGGGDLRVNGNFDGNLAAIGLVGANPLMFFTNNTERARIDANGNIEVKNSASVPSSNPSGGGVLYVEGGALKYRGSSGTVTTIANA
jgi:hypothetical protein